ncbi:MAG: phenylalanine--tRNA ligase subunit alpha [Candidatus Paceibacterota bacterium]
MKEEAIQALEEAKNVEKIEELRIFYLGRKGEVTTALRALAEKSIEEKRKEGPELNALRKELEEKIEGRRKELSLKSEADFDLTMPGKKLRRGSLHPLSRVEKEIVSIFKSMNFSVAEGPEAESEYYNFDALNIPENHPAREMWDTFWLANNQKVSDNNSQSLNKKNERFLMRTHTSPVQIRFMKEHKPPFQIVVPGRVFRYEATDMSHEINFHQIEGLSIGRSINLANFKFIIEEFFNRFFGKKLEFRFRPSYFPFVEPGVELDIKMPGGNRWLEVMGAGMVHRNVLKAVGISEKEWQGFAFGMGVERLAMLKYKIPDIRMFYVNDLRFIKQF